MADTLTTYAAIVKRVIHDYALNPGHGHIIAQVVHDPDQHRYLLMHVGWNGTRRIHGVIADIRVEDDRVIIEHDGVLSPPGLMAELVAAGIPEDVIVPAFWQPTLSATTTS